MTRTIRGIAALLAAGLALAGCGSDGAELQSSSATSPPSSSAPPTSSSPAASSSAPPVSVSSAPSASSSTVGSVATAAASQPSGLVLFECGNVMAGRMGHELTGDKQSFPIDVALSPSGSAAEVASNICYTGGPRVLEGALSPFTRDFQFTAANKKQASGGTHTGVVNLETGAFTDISANLGDSSGDFSSGVTSDSFYGISADDVFYFTHGDDEQIYESTLTGSSWSASAPSNKTYQQLLGTRWQGQSPAYLSGPGGGLLYEVPSGEAVPSRCEGCSANDYESKANQYFAPTFGTSACEKGNAKGWLDATHVLCEVDVAGASDKYRIFAWDITAGEYLSCAEGEAKYNPDDTGIYDFCNLYDRGWWFDNLDSESLLPANSRNNRQVVASPEGSEFAFASKQGDIDSIYTMSTNGGEPHKILDIADDPRFESASDLRLAWLPSA